MTGLAETAHGRYPGITENSNSKQGVHTAPAAQISTAMVVSATLAPRYGCSADAALRRIVATGKDTGIGLAAAGAAESIVPTIIGWIGEARRLRQGVLLNPQSMARATSSVPAWRRTRSAGRCG